MLKVFWGVFGLAITAVALVFGVGFYLSPNDLDSCAASPTVNDTECERADAIVAISGGDTRARTAKAIELYKNDWADKLIFSGAAFDKNSPSNAYEMSQQAIEAGIDPGAITVEEFARDTHENATKTKEITGEDFDRYILVTSGYHQRRAYIEFERVFDGAVIVNAPVEEDRQWSESWWTTKRGWHLAVGELIKIFIRYSQGN